MSISHEHKQKEKTNAQLVLEATKKRHKLKNTKVVRLPSNEGDFARELRKIKEDTQGELVSTSIAAMITGKNNGFINLSVKQGLLDVVEVIKKVKYYKRTDVLKLMEAHDKLHSVAKLTKQLDVSTTKMTAELKINDIELIRVGKLFYVNTEDVEKIKTFFK